MSTVDESWSFEDLSFEFLMEYEKTREEWFANSAKGQLLNEMITERYMDKEFESETLKFLENKYEIIRYHRDRFYDIQKYLGNLKDGFPFNVRRSVGRYMVKFELTADQAEMFVNTHRKHLSMFERESEAWKMRTIGHVVKVLWNDEDDCLYVHFDDGEWWHYCRDLTWY